MAVKFASPPGRSHVEEFGSIELAKIGGKLKAFEVLSQKVVDRAGQRCFMAIYTYDDNGRKMKSQGYFFLPKATGLVIQCMATEAAYDTCAPIFDKMIASMQFTN